MATSEGEALCASLLDLAIDWDGNIDNLIGIGSKLVAQYRVMDGDDDEHAVRKICDVLLERSDLPALYRAQFLVFMSTTEEETDFDSMMDRMVAAEAALADAKDNCPYGHKHTAECNIRVENLSTTVQNMSDDILDAMDELDPSSSPHSPPHSPAIKVQSPSPSVTVIEPEPAKDLSDKLDGLHLTPKAGSLRRRPKMLPALRMKKSNQNFLAAGFTPTQPIVQEAKTLRSLSSMNIPKDGGDDKQQL
ncbi:hypothetical protein TI39_contig311g00013 [Zymoseptoria brevis]|uniref:Uncharacterized protein n=1 Tax=Zymoseptoria brevis TaxID=1047168 RepID=A0A0F4GTR9_9PEZI|nr:hypothetical protein TI39_contig311g00013 [Zymoseptoria brevis]